GPAEAWARSAEGDRLPRLRVRTIERTALVRFEGAEILYDGAAVRAVGEQLESLARQGHTRPLLKLSGGRDPSRDVLGVLALREKKIDRAGGRIQVCGLDPLLRDMLRITRLDDVFDVCADEAEALGLLVS